MKPGELNRLIDATFHPLARRNGLFWLLDFGAHFLVESKDPKKAVKKAVRYYSREFAQRWKDYHDGGRV